MTSESDARGVFSFLCKIKYSSVVLCVLLSNLMMFFFGSFSSVSAETPLPDLNLNFSSIYHIDDEKLRLRDPNGDFYYDLIPPPGAVKGLGTLPIHIERGTEARVWLDRSVVPGLTNPEARSLAIQINSQATEHVKDKIFLNLVPFDSSLHMSPDLPGNRRYLSFDFMLDQNYEIPYAWAIHLQVWQCCGGHPPFTIAVVPGGNKFGPVRLTFGVRDDAAERAVGHPERIFYEIGISRGEWHHVILTFEPQSDASMRSGLISLGIDGTERRTFVGHWGFDPKQPKFQGHAFSSYMGIEFGVYRQRQATSQRLYFDNVKYGKSLSDVAF